MAVMITSECIVCDACATECPVAAILDDSNEKNPQDNKYYVKPESCVECVGHADAPRCAEICPTEGAIVWDMPYISSYEQYYMQGHDEGRYAIRIHAKKGIFSPTKSPKPFRETISLEDRTAHIAVSI
jgi:ferredoxin